LDVSCVVVLHRQGLAAHRGLRGLARALEACERAGVSAEAILVLDQPDEETAAVAARWRPALPRAVAVAAQLDDRGLARNLGMSAARGEYATLVDGDDLVGRTWLTAAHRMASEGPRAWVLHPEVNVRFGDRACWWRSPDQEAGMFPAANLLFSNYWTGAAFARREVFLQIPFESCPRGSGFGHEDWHWNVQVMAAGHRHKVVAGTVQFLRGRAGSRPLASYDSEEGLTIRPSAFFGRERFSSLLGGETPGGASRGTVREATAARLRRFVAPWHRLVSAAAQAANRVSRELIDPETQPTLALWLERGRSLALSSRRHLLAEMPAWVLDEMRSLAEVEPLLYPDRTLVDRAPLLTLPPRSTQTSAYAAALGALGGDRYSHVMLTPRIKQGGADLDTLQHLRALAGSGQRAALVITERGPSVWLDRLPPGVGVISFGELASGLRLQEAANVLLRLLLEAKPAVIHNINSHLGWLLFSRHGGALSQGSKLFASLFSHALSPAGRPAGFHEHLPQAYPHLTAVIIDNRWYADYLCETYGYSSERVRCVYFPVEVAPPSGRWRPPSRGERRPILWASRISRQKRPDVLVRVAQALPEHEFHVWGYVDDPDGRRHAAALRRLPNVQLIGPYRYFTEIPAAEYALFLYTSQWDGLPNVVLEAAGTGLPIVASAVGGLPDFVSHETGFPITPGDDVGAFVRTIESIAADPGVAAARSQAAFELLASRHSWDAFVRSLRALPGYVPDNAP
jgi:glycosyltransferase involved in cell wall biosynthesis